MTSSMASLKCLSVESNIDVNGIGETFSSEFLASLPSVYGSRSEENIDPAELPFLEADVREVFEILNKSGFRPKKGRKRFWKRKHWCHRPKMVDQQHVLPCEEKDRNGMLKKQQLEEGQKMIVGDGWHQVKGRPTSDVAVQTQQEQGKAGKAPCVTVTVQQQWDGGEVPEVTVEVQQPGQMTEVPCVTVQVQQGGKVGAVSHVSVKVQQQIRGRDTPGPWCVTVHVEQRTQRGETPEKLAHWQHAGNAKHVSRVMQEHQQTQCNEELIAAEGKQQLKEGTNMKESRFMQDAQESMETRGLLQQIRDQSTEQLKPKQLIPTDQAQTGLGTAVTEKQLHEDSQVSEDKQTLNLHSWSRTEEKEQQQSEDEKGLNVFDQPQQICSDKGPPRQIIEEQRREHEEEAQTVSKKHRRDTPNYFVAIPITNDQFLDKIEDVQEFIFNKEPDLLRALIPVQTMHITIIVAHLRTEDDVKRAVSALEYSKAKVEALLQGNPFNMTFNGIDQFNNQVIYIKMSEDEEQMLSKIAEAVESSFNEMNVAILTGSKDFKPHLTLLKLSKASALRRKGFRKINTELYTEYEHFCFGTETLSQIDLCAMHKKKQDSGYYHCEHSIKVSPTNSDEKNKELQMEDVRETIIGTHLIDGTDNGPGGTLADYDFALLSNDKAPENLDGGLVITVGEHHAVRKVDIEDTAKDETSAADGELFSKVVCEPLPVNPEAIGTGCETGKCKDDRW